jgi:hypothetical protein
MQKLTTRYQGLLLNGKIAAAPTSPPPEPKLETVDRNLFKFLRARNRLPRDLRPDEIAMIREDGVQAYIQGIKLLETVRTQFKNDKN